MPSHDHTSLTPHEEFCLALKAAREQKKITLNEIAEATKVPSYLFAALERCDLKRWPSGLFRRSFFRGYVAMIGVAVDDACDEFARLFPDREETIAEIAVVAPARPRPMTLRVKLPRWLARFY